MESGLCFFVVSGLGFGVNFEFRVSDFWFLISGFRFQVSGFGFRISGFGFRVSGFRFRVSGFGFRASGFKFLIWSLGFGVSGFGVDVYRDVARNVTASGEDHLHAPPLRGQRRWHHLPFGIGVTFPHNIDWVLLEQVSH